MPNSKQFPDSLKTHCLTDFRTIDFDGLRAGISERLAVPIPGLEVSRPSRHRFPADKWILSSATQKLIRRGQADDAVETALALHEIDPAYLPRRLPIIAFEDVSIGGLDVCFDVLHVFGAQRYPAGTSEQEQRQLIANLVYRLAGAVKSRSACDIFCLGHAELDGTPTAAKMMAASERCLIKIAVDRDAAVTKRAFALHLLSGMSMQEGRWSRAVSRFNADALNAVSEKLDLPPLMAWMIAKGRNTLALAAMLPLVLEATTKRNELRIEKSKLQTEKLILGLPAYAADQYTRCGRSAIAEFSSMLRLRHPHFFEAIPDARNHAKLVGMAIFHAEGSKLDRWVENQTLAAYREQIEQFELQALGWPESAPRHQVYELLETERRLLWKIRQSHLQDAFGKRGGGE